MVSTRFVLIVLACLSAASAQLLNNTVELDPDGTFRLNWSVDYSLNPSNPTIIFETRVKTQGNK